jgi:hypothetical protein
MGVFLGLMTYQCSFLGQGRELDNLVAISLLDASKESLVKIEVSLVLVLVLVLPLAMTPLQPPVGLQFPMSMNKTVTGLHVEVSMIQVSSVSDTPSWPSTRSLRIISPLT